MDKNSNVALDVLEKRIQLLESQVLPVEYTKADHATNITEILLETQSMVSTALTCRETIVSLLERLPKINEVLNPAYPMDDVELELRRQHALALYSSVKDSAGQLEEYSSLRRFEETKDLDKIFSMSGNLQSLLLNYSGLYKESSEVTLKVGQFLQEYFNFINTFTKLFAQMDKSLSELEVSLHPKSKSEE